MYFCKENDRLFAYERLMREPPGYRARKSGIHISDKEKVIADIMKNRERKEMILRIITDTFMKRMYNVCGEKDWKTSFRSYEHKELFNCIFSGSKGAMMNRSSRYLAAVFLLSANNKLWERMDNTAVTDHSINFDRISLCCVTKEQYILFYMAKEIYTGRQYIHLDALYDRESIPEEFHRLFANAFLMRACGACVLPYFQEDEFDE